MLERKPLPEHVIVEASGLCVLYMMLFIQGHSQ
jgi:hypothetical protein